MSIHLTRATFAPHVGDTFHIHAFPPDTLPVTLIAVNELTARALPPVASPQKESFSLVFRGPQAPQLEQGIYDFTHGEIGAFALFIVPIGATPDGIRYEAVFNRMAVAPTP